MKATTRITVQVVTACLGAICMLTIANAEDECAIKTPTLRIDRHTLDFSEKRPICVKPNDKFKIKLIAAPNYVIDPETITVKEKRGSIEIKKFAIDSGFLRVKVGDLPPGTEHEYMIKVAGVGVLDPRVRINTNYVAFNPAQESLDEDMHAKYGLSLLELRDIDLYFREMHHTSIDAVLKSLEESTTSD